MHASLRSLDSPALAPNGLDSYEPPLSDDFGILLSALIGPAGGEGEEVFYVTVCTAKWLARVTLEENGKGFEFLRDHLVVDRWDPALFRRAIGDLCAHTAGADWPEIGNKLSRYFAWEYEDYTP